MSLMDLYDSCSSCVVAFIDRLQALPAGKLPMFPRIIGTGFLATADGVVLTNRHVVDCIDNLEVNGVFTGGALLMLVDSERKGCQLLNVDIHTSGVLETFSSNDSWYGQDVPDIGFVQLRVRETSFLELATEDFAIRPGMEISTIGFPMGTVPLTLHNKVGQISPFIRRGIISSVYPFSIARPHGFTIDITQQGGSSGSPIFNSEGRVVGMMWGNVNDVRTAKSDTASLQYILPTNISLAEPAHLIDAALKEMLKDNPPVRTAIPTLQELRDKQPMPTETVGFTWSTWPRS